MEPYLFLPHGFGRPGRGDVPWWDSVPRKESQAHRDMSAQHRTPPFIYTFPRRSLFNRHIYFHVDDANSKYSPPGGRGELPQPCAAGRPATSVLKVSVCGRETCPLGRPLSSVPEVVHPPGQNHRIPFGLKPGIPGKMYFFLSHPIMSIKYRFLWYKWLHEFGRVYAFICRGSLKSCKNTEEILLVLSWKCPKHFFLCLFSLVSSTETVCWMNCCLCKSI